MRRSVRFFLLWTHYPGTSWGDLWKLAAETPDV